MINYKILQESIDYYECKGFKRIESPWLVSEYVSSITKPIGVQAYEIKHNDKYLVASGEQSFLYLYLKEFLPKGRFQTTTPCFRLDKFDATHSKYFIKNELIQTDFVCDKALSDVVEMCLNFYREYLPKSEVVKTESGFDIECFGIELGSYGIRKCDFLYWIYGTGCAEPRLSRTINRIKDTIGD